MQFEHVPVLLEQVVTALAARDDEVFVDCTLGGGGHTEALLASCACRVIGLDRDPAALSAARERLARYGDRFIAVQGRFSHLNDVLDSLKVGQVHGVLADLGVSSHQLDTDARGFSFRRSGPIDMRMNPQDLVSAADVVNQWAESDLADAIYQYGEERHARRIARAIVQGRPWKDTLQLADAISRLGASRKSRIHPATRTFQALRIVVNDELGELRSLLPQALDRLHPGGRMAIISFHSLEDRIVKQFFAQESGKNTEKDPFGNLIIPPKLARPARSVTASADDPNPRARSARLRLAVRL